MVHEYWEGEWDRIAREKTGTQCISGWGRDFSFDAIGINRSYILCKGGATKPCE